MWQTAVGYSSKQDLGVNSKHLRHSHLRLIPYKVVTIDYAQFGISLGSLTICIQKLTQNQLTKLNSFHTPIDLHPNNPKQQTG